MGYTGGTTEGPTYESVCGGGTGHAEAVLVEFDPKRITFAQLLDAFWANHSPKSERKGQYRSAVFALGADQLATADLSKSSVEKKLGREVATEIKAAGRFWLAEDYHQQYYEKTGVYACPTR